MIRTVLENKLYDFEGSVEEAKEILILARDNHKLDDPIMDDFYQEIIRSGFLKRKSDLITFDREDKIIIIGTYQYCTIDNCELVLRKLNSESKYSFWGFGKKYKKKGIRLPPELFNRKPQENTREVKEENTNN